MGNQPSAPTPAPIQATGSPAPPPPLPPQCDMQCQKEKQLALLKSAMDSTNPDSDPAGYEKARIAYFTLLNGPGWLAQEKSRIAKEEVEPVLSSYRTQFNAMKGEQQTGHIFSNLATALNSQQIADEQSNQYLKKQLTAEKDKAQTSDRLVQLSGTTAQPSPYISWAIDIILALLGLFVAYKIYIRFFGSVTISESLPDLTST